MHDVHSPSYQAPIHIHGLDFSQFQKFKFAKRKWSDRHLCAIQDKEKKIKD